MDPLRLAEAQGVEFALLGHTVGHSIQFRVFWQCTPQTLTKPIIAAFYICRLKNRFSPPPSAIGVHTADYSIYPTRAGY